MSTSLLTLLDRVSDNETNGLRLLDRHERETWLDWKQLNARARRTAGKLQAAGIEHGERVVLVYPTCAEFFDASGNTNVTVTTAGSPSGTTATARETPVKNISTRSNYGSVTSSSAGTSRTSSPKPWSVGRSSGPATPGSAASRGTSSEPTGPRRVTARRSP